jgi:hypothetical protein
MIDLGSWAETLGLRRKKTLADRVQDFAEEVVDTVVPVLTKPAKAVASVKVADAVYPALSRSRHAAEDALRHSGKAATTAWQRTGKTASAGLESVADLAGDATATVASTAAVTGAAAAGVATGVGGFLAGVFSWLWKLTTFLFKAAILAGIAYAGWQWLQSRREQQDWQTPGSDASFSSSTYGAVTPDSTPATAGAR